MSNMSIGSVIWMLASCRNEFGPDPQIAAWKPTQDQVERIQELRRVVNEHNLESCSIYMNVTQWGPGSDDEDDFEDEYRVEGGRLIVDGSQIHFTAWLKYVEHEITTETVQIDQLLAAIDAGEEHAYLGGNMPGDVHNTVEQCGGPILRGE